MAFGILEDHKLDNVPGTGLLSAKAGPLSTDEAKELKHGSGKYSHIILIPQPSDDPCDPLNWPRWKKEACFWTLVSVTSVADSLASFTNSGFFQLAKQLDVSVDEVASTFSVILPGAAVFMLLQSPFALKYGHRAVYLLSTFFMFVACFWTALSPNLASIRASRIVQGFGQAASKCLIAATIEHLYFVHERGSRSCVCTIFQWIGSTVATLINGYVIQGLSWRLGFWFIGIAGGLFFIAVFVFVPETTYHRQASSIHPERTDRACSINNDNIEKASQTLEGDISPVDLSPRSSNTPTFLSQLKVYNGTLSDESLWRIFLRPFPFVLSPVTWFLLLSYTIPSCFQTLVSVCSSTIFTVTYGFNASETALTNVGCLVGVIIAMVVIGPLNDWWIIWMSRHNQGIYEPEYRIVFMFSLLLEGFGYIGWAIGNNRHMPWVGAVACLATIYFSTVVSGSARLAYLIDTHGANALHIMVLTECARNLLSYGTSFFANGAILSAGVERTLLAVGACEAVLCLTCVPTMYVYGKRARSFIARHPHLFLFSVSAETPSRHPIATRDSPQLNPRARPGPGQGSNRNVERLRAA